MGKPQMEVRVGHAANGTPVFMVHGQHLAYARVFGASWDIKRALWMYPAFYPASTKVLADLATIGDTVDVRFSAVAQQHIQALAQVPARIQARALPPAFTYATPPYDHQVEGLCHVYYNHRAALFYDPGLGKSKIAIDLMRLLHLGGRRSCALVVGPRVTIENWGREIDRHADRQLSWIALTGTPTQKRAALARAVAEQTDVVVVTYDTARRIADLLVEQLPYELVVYDESHNVKAWQSGRTRAAWEIAQKASRRVLMTGSPTEGNPLDLYGPYKILGDCFMPEEFFRFKKRFVTTAGEHSPIVTGYKNLDIINARTTFLGLRHTKEECLDLPPRTFVDVPYTLSALQARIYNQIVLEMGIDPARLLDPTAPLTILPTLPPAMELPHRAAALLKLLQVTTGFITKNEKDPAFCDTAGPGGGACPHLRACVRDDIAPRTPRCQVDATPWPTTTTIFDDNPKHEAIAELLEGLLVSAHAKVIVWCVFHTEMDILGTRLDAAGIRYVRVDGKTARPMEAVDQFNDDPATRVYIGQVASGIGINLVASSYVIYSSLPYGLIPWTQSLDRNYRIGQTQPVTVYRMIGHATLEAAVAYLLDHKVNVDAMLTNKVQCVTCPHSIKCIYEHIEPFEKGCVYPTHVTRTVIKARALSMYTGDQ